MKHFFTVLFVTAFSVSYLFPQVPNNDLIDHVTNLPVNSISQRFFPAGSAVQNSSRSTCSPCNPGVNMVPNPGFETLTSCPMNNCGCIMYMSPPWACANGASPNLFNACSTNSGSCALGVPDNFAGHRSAHGGNGYAGFATYAGGSVSYREYVEVPLLSRMNPGTTYYVEFFVTVPDLVAQIATNNLGAYFSVDSLVSTNQTYFPVIPQVYSTTVITDTANWVKICGEFTALDTFGFVTIGNFFSDASTTLVIANSSGSYDDGYYYIDDVLVAASGGTGPAGFSHDTSVCNGRSIVLNAGPTPGSYFWNDSSTTQTLSVNAAGLYTVTITDTSGCIAKDSFTVRAGSSGLTVTYHDTSLCNGSLVLNPGTTSGTYFWNDSSTSQTISVSTLGLYIVTITDTSGCAAKDSFLVWGSGLGPVHVAADKSIMCSSDSALICATSGFTSYHWNVGGTDSCFYAKSAGNYYVTVANAQGCSEESNHIALAIYPSPPVSISINGDTLTAHNAVTYQWLLNGVRVTGATSHIYIAKGRGTYTVEVTDSNGCSTVSNPISVMSLEDVMETRISVYPNPSSGNWELEVDKSLLGGEIEIFDASGRLVFHSKIQNLKSDLEPDLASGVYLLRVSSKNNVATTKLIRW